MRVCCSVLHVVGCAWASSTVSCTLQALSTAVHEHLRVVDAYLHRLARLVKTQDRVLLSCAGDAGRGGAAQSGARSGARTRSASITLLVLHHMLASKLKLVDTLEQVLQGAMHPLGRQASAAQEAHQVSCFSLPPPVALPCLPQALTQRRVRLVAGARRRLGTCIEQQQKHGFKVMPSATWCCTGCLPPPCCRT